MSLVAMSSIRRKIEETEKYLQELNSVENTSYLKFEAAEVARRLENLRKQEAALEASQGKETISLRFHGDSVQEGRISNRILALMLQGFQGTVDEIANAITGSGAQRGQISESTKRRVDFDVIATFPGSFGITLEKDYGQEEILSDDYETGQILDSLFSLMENSNNTEALIDVISAYGNRAVSKYKSWLTDMKNNSLNVEFSWDNEISERRHLDLSSSDVIHAVKVLDEIGDIQEEEISMQGTITGLNIRSCTFEVQSANESRIIRGKGDLDTLRQISPLLGKMADIKFQKRTAFSSVYGEKEKYTILDATHIN